MQTPQVAFLASHGNVAPLSRPACSYNCLVGLALRQSGAGRLQVQDIYSFIENGFAYYKNQSSGGWKSSIRHSLSLGSYFRKADTNSSNQLFGKKGHFWEVVPDKQAMLDKEIASYFAQPHYDSTSLSTLPAVKMPPRVAPTSSPLLTDAEIILQTLSPLVPNLSVKEGSQLEREINAIVAFLLEGAPEPPLLAAAPPSPKPKAAEPDAPEAADHGEREPEILVLETSEDYDNDEVQLLEVFEDFELFFSGSEADDAEDTAILLSSDDESDCGGFADDEAEFSSDDNELTSDEEDNTGEMDQLIFAENLTSPLLCADEDFAELCCHDDEVLSVSSPIPTHLKVADCGWTNWQNHGYLHNFLLEDSLSEEEMNTAAAASCVQAGVRLPHSRKQLPDWSAAAAASSGGKWVARFQEDPTQAARRASRKRSRSVMGREPPSCREAAPVCYKRPRLTPQVRGKVAPSHAVQPVRGKVAPSHAVQPVRGKVAPSHAVQPVEEEDGDDLTVSIGFRQLMTKRQQRKYFS